MKKHLLLLLSLLLTTTMLFAERVSQSDAATVASNFLNGAVTSTKKSKAVTPNRMTLKTAAAASESQYYVYENPDGGWVMVSASDVLQPILAYSKTGTFSFDNQPDNVKKWLGKYEDLIKKVEADGVEASAEASAQWNALKKSLPDDPAGTVIVGPLVQTTWDQGKPYDYYTPGTGSYGSGTKAAVGCVATAMAQVMKFWEWPVNGTGSHKYQPEMDIWEENESTGEYEYKETIVIFEGELEADFENTTYQWAKMKNSYSSNYNADPDRAVATLMYHCGIAVDMQYGGSDYDGSGAQTINYNDDDELCAQNALWKYFRYKKDGLVSYKRDGYTYNGTKYYNSWTDAAWTAMVKEELDKQHPIMYDGSGTGGHSFICDGYDSKDYFHFNWGWSGSNDGWYKLNNLVPGSGGAGGGSYSFSEDQGVIIGIVPDKPDEDLYILGEVEGNGYNWDPSKGAKMNFANNVFTLTTRIQGTGGYGYLSFTTALASGSSAWDEIASSRLGADASDKLVSSGSTYNLTTNYDNAFKFADGIWTITVDLENKKMTAVKPTTYTVTWNNSGTEKQVEFVKDAALELPAAPSACDNGKVFVGWTEATSVNADVAPEDLFTKAGTKTVTKNITYNAVFATPTSGGSGAGWELVTDASTLKEGDVLVIASNSKGKTAGDISNSIMAEVESTFEGTDLQSLGDGTVELTLGGSEGAWTLTSSEGSLGATVVKKVAWDNGTTTWSISISDNNATIQNGTEAYGRFLHNVGSNRFTTYTSNTSTAMLLPQLYRKASSYSDFSLGCGTVTPVATEWTITLVEIPNGWGSDINLYAWREDGDGITDGDNNSFAWPGIAMTKNRGTTYTATVRVYGSDPVANIIFNDGTSQTVDITNVTGPGRFRVNGKTVQEGGLQKNTTDLVYKVSLAELSHGEISGLSTWYAAGDEVSFTATPDENYNLSSLTVKEDESGNEVSVSGGKFTMPAADVTLAAVFAKESAKVTVTWSVDGKTTMVEFNEGDALVLPTAPDACDNGKVFVGWTTDASFTGTDEQIAAILTKADEKTVDADITYYAVFATAGEGGSGSGTSVTLTMSDYEKVSGDIGGFTFAAGGSGTQATYNTNGKDARFYASNTLTISSATAMTKIVFNLSSQGKKRLAPITASDGVISDQASGDETVTWTGSATEVTFTVGAKANYGSEGDTKAGQLCFTSVDIAIGGGSSYSDYSLTCGGSTPAATKYVLAGEGGPLTTWTPADAPEMMVKDGFATLAFTNVAVEANTTIEYKVVILEDGQEPVWIGDGDNNYTFYINDAGHYNLTFSYDIDGKAASCYAEYIPDLYILGQVEGNGYAWGPNIGTKMNYADGLYTLTTRVASAADGYDPGFISFTTKLASADDWSELSNSDRWAADENDKEVADGQSYTLQQENVGNAFKFAAGTWTITVDLINKKVSIVLVSLDETPATKVTVTWNDRGTETPVEFNEGDALVLPANPAACANGKVFVGWTTSNAVDGSAPAVLFKEAGTMTVDADITYYAVFATASGSGSGSGTLVTLTMSDYEAVSGSIGDFTFTAGGSGTQAAYNGTGKDARYYAGNTLTISSASAMTEIVFILSSQGKKRLAPITASDGVISDQASGDETVTWTGSATEVTFTVGAKANYGSDGESKAGQLCFTSVDITTGGGSSYSNYSLDCEGGSVDPEEVNLTPTNAQAWYYADYSTSGSHNWVMNFADGDFDVASWSFNMQIEVNTAEANALAGSYDENDGVVIGLPDETHTVLMDGVKTVEGKEVSLKLTYNSKDAAGNPTYDVVISFLGDDGKLYKINKEALAIIAKDVDSEDLIDLYGDTGTPLTKYDIVYYTCGEQYTTQSYYDGDTLWFPSIPPAQNGKAFVGWTTEEHYTKATAPTFVEEGTAVHASANYHAVYK